ncbi:hypothetical protein SDC9_181215 [bioreactor metagenome]|uniref:Uncharacterized protein n=1 Tax=bioreactor metagenome TaxID=1076179 RepID=A0A645HCA7_9ZZZZ
MTSRRQCFRLIHCFNAVSKVSAGGKPLRIVYTVDPSARIDFYFHNLRLAVRFDACCNHKTRCGIVAGTAGYRADDYRSRRRTVFLYRPADYISGNRVQGIGYADTVSGICPSYLGSVRRIRSRGGA